MPSLQENVASIAAFYKAQAPEYHEGTYGTGMIDAAYAPLKSRYKQAFAGRSVLEIACGTGYWTRVLAETAKDVLATDFNPELVETTRHRVASCPNVRCQVADAYTLENVDGVLTGAFAHYWWSHIPKKMRKGFLDVLHGKLQPGAFVLFTDDLDYYADSVQRRTDEHGDLYEERILRDGSRFETLKNFPDESELFELLDGSADNLTYTEHDLELNQQVTSRVWTVSYQLRKR